MSTNPSALIQQKIDAVDRRWRWVKFGEYFFTAGSGFVAVWLVAELCAWRGILSEPWLFIVFVGLYGIAVLLAVMGIGVYVSASEPRRAWLAARLERGCPGLLDRLNTLVYLERLRRPFPYALRRQIEAQAATVIEQQPVTAKFSTVRLAWLFGLFTFLLAGALLFNAHFHPFAALLHPPVAASPSAAKNDAPFELVPGDVNETTKPAKPWGEVRIVNPGRDVKLTKIDVLPLQIEMAASGQLQNPAWITSINGGPEQRHELAPPSEPQYAVYQPMIYLDQLQVSDWDVVSYYAKVETNAPAEYASQIYFIEVRPFQEDILKHTGGGKGGGGHGADLLEKLNELVRRQTTVVQDTHKYQQTEYPTEEMRKQDKGKLADAEGGLSDASNHLYGEIVAENENAPIGEILDHLAGAQQQMDKAVDNLGEEIIPLAKQNEQSALAELVATRKAFYKCLCQNPGAFGDGSNPDEKNNPVVSAKDSLASLSQVTEMHDRDVAALKQLHELAQRQQELANSGVAGNSAGAAAASASETDLKNATDKLVDENPDLFRGVDAAKASMESDMQQAIDNLGANQNNVGHHYMTHAASDMADLEKAVQHNHQLQQMAEAYKLKKIIDQNVQQLGQEKAKGGALSPEEKQALIDSATRSTGTLKDIADQPGHSGFGPSLGQALSADNQAALQRALQDLGAAKPGSDSQAAAGAAQGNLAKVSQAFEQSEPRLGDTNSGQGQPGGQSSDSAKSGELDNAMQELQGLILAQQEKPAPPGADQNKAQNQVLGELEDALSKENSPKAEALLAQVQDMKKKKTPLPFPPDALKKLLDQIQLMNAEASDPNKDKANKAEITVIDASKFPESYRDRIRAYYEQLSNRPQ
jgi:hypothetical protein